MAHRYIFPLVDSVRVRAPRPRNLTQYWLHVFQFSSHIGFGGSTVHDISHKAAPLPKSIICATLCPPSTNHCLRWTFLAFRPNSYHMPRLIEGRSTDCSALCLPCLVLVLLFAWLKWRAENPCPIGDGLARLARRRREHSVGSGN